MNDPYIHRKQREGIIIPMEPVKRITLEEALASGKPIYTRALGVPELLTKGIKHIIRAIDDGNAKDTGDHVKFTTDVYIYNYLNKNIILQSSGTQYPK